MERKLFRSRADKVIAGVCGGLGHYLDIDPTIVRVVFVLLGIADGIGVIAYLALWLLTPVEGSAPAVTDSGETVRAGAQEIAEKVQEIAGKAEEIGAGIRKAAREGQPHSGGIVIGMVLVAVGTIFLLQNLNIFWFRRIGLHVLWPVILIAIGVGLLVRPGKGE